MKIFFDSQQLEGMKNYNLDYLMPIMKAYSKHKFRILAEKDKQYGGSWQKDGVIGAWFNLKRKIDRAITQFKLGNLFKPESIDTFIDMDNYSQLIVAYNILNADKQRFELFTQEIPELRNVLMWDDENQCVNILEIKQQY